MVRRQPAGGQGQSARAVRSGALRVVFAGTPAPALTALRALLGSRHEVVAVVTRPDSRAGRGRQVAVSPVGALAAEAGIEVLKPARPRDPDFLDQLRAIAPDCCPVVAYGALVPPAALAIPGHGWVNLHFSLLPAWRGAAPVQHALLGGDEVTGATTFRLEEGLDTGPVFGVVTETIRPTDTAGDLLDRLAETGAALLLATLDGIEDGSARPQAQPAEGVSLAPKLSVDDVRVDWHAPALRVDRLTRATHPAPGAWTTLRGRRVKLGPVQRVSAAGPIAADVVPALAPGELAHLARSGVAVGTGSEAVLLGEVRPEGKPSMPARDWARGVRLVAGDRLT